MAPSLTEKRMLKSLQSVQTSIPCVVYTVHKWVEIGEDHDGIRIFACGGRFGAGGRDRIARFAAAGSPLEERLDGLATRTGQDEYKSDYVSEKLQIELKQMKQNGQMVQAVKHLRESTGLDLLRAKQYIDRLS